MTQGSGAAAGTAEFAEAHRRLLADRAIQFELPPVVTPETPAWLRAIGEFLLAVLPVLKGLWWVGLILLGLIVLALILDRFFGVEWPWRRRAAEAASEAWQPEEAPARELLREADALAGAGRYSEAAHLLLFRSIEDIDSRRPQLVRPALTSRDIAGAPDIPPGPRAAFAAIAMLVERSLFGGRALGAEDWRACRGAYERFAFAEEWS